MSCRLQANMPEIIINRTTARNGCDGRTDKNVKKKKTNIKNTRRQRRAPRTVYSMSRALFYSMDRGVRTFPRRRCNDDTKLLAIAITFAARQEFISITFNVTVFVVRYAFRRNFNLVARIIVL